MDDSSKPRRSRLAEVAEIHDHIARTEEDAEAKFLQQIQIPPGMALLMEEEAALDAQSELEKQFFNEIVESDPEYFFGSRPTD